MTQCQTGRAKQNRRHSLIWHSNSSTISKAYIPKTEMSQETNARNKRKKTVKKRRK